MLELRARLCTYLSRLERRGRPDHGGPKQRFDSYVASSSLLVSASFGFVTRLLFDQCTREHRTQATPTQALDFACPAYKLLAGRHAVSHHRSRLGAPRTSFFFQCLQNCIQGSQNQFRKPFISIQGHERDGTVLTCRGAHSLCLLFFSTSLPNPGTAYAISSHYKTTKSLKLLPCGSQSSEKPTIHTKTRAPKIRNMGHQTTLLFCPLPPGRQQETANIFRVFPAFSISTQTLPNHAHCGNKPPQPRQELIQCSAARHGCLFMYTHFWVWWLLPAIEKACPRFGWLLPPQRPPADVGGKVVEGVPMDATVLWPHHPQTSQCLVPPRPACWQGGRGVGAVQQCRQGTQRPPAEKCRQALDSAARSPLHFFFFSSSPASSHTQRRRPEKKGVSWPWPCVFLACPRR